MSNPRERYTVGGHRLPSPAAALERIRPLLGPCGVTRCADITRLDLDLGVHTCCAIRPGATTLQVSNGKGFTKEGAQISALMEALELHHAERPDPARLRWASEEELSRAGQPYLAPAALPGFLGRPTSPRLRLEWTEAQELTHGRALWIPAGVVHPFREPQLHRWTSVGFGAGGDPIEATLHGVCELLEEDAIARLSVDGRLQIAGRAAVVDPASIEDADLGRVVRAVEAAGSKLVLLWIPAAIPVPVFWAFLLNLDPAASASTLNVGRGAHVDATIAASRAVTEAVQSRLTSIHGAREDLLEKASYQRPADVRSSRAFRYFAALTPTHAFGALPSAGIAATDLEEILAELLRQLAEAGQVVLRVDLTRPDLGLPVVKVLSPTLATSRR